MNLKIAQVIGLNTDQRAAQAASSVRDDNAFLAILELISDDAFTKGRQILSELEDFYFDLEGTISEKLNATFQEVSKKIPEETDWSLSLVAISGKVLYLIGKGQVEVYLKRENKLSPLLSVGTSSQLISGFINPFDRLLLSTKSLVTFLGTDLQKSISLPIENFEEEVTGKIGTAETEDHGLAGLIVEVLEETPEIAPLPEAEQQTQETDQDSSRKSSVLLKAILSQAVGYIGSIKTRLPKSGRGRAIVAIVLIVIIILGALYQYKLSLDRKIQAQFAQTLQEARDDFNGAKGLASLNPADAKTKLDLAKGKVDKALQLKPKDTDAQSLKTQIEQESPSILQQSAVADFPVFLDLDLIKKNFRAAQMSLSGNKLLLLDPEVKTLVLVDLTKKSNQILAGLDQLGDATLFSLNGAMVFVYSKDKGILKIDSANQKISTVAKKDSDLGEVKDIYAFAGNIYLLDKGHPPAGGQVWKYLPTSDGYSDKREYFSKDTKADLSSSLRMQIESSIFVLKSGGEMLRFTKGDKDNFSFSGLPSGVKEPKSFFVSSDTDNLYLLDSGNSRLLILTKIGGYKGQITGGKFATATDLAVDEVGKKVYLLDGGKIFQVDLK